MKKDEFIGWLKGYRAGIGDFEGVELIDEIFTAIIEQAETIDSTTYTQPYYPWIWYGNSPTVYGQKWMDCNAPDSYTYTVGGLESGGGKGYNNDWEITGDSHGWEVKHS